MKTLKNLYVIAGRSGSGKTTAVEGLRHNYGYIQAESYTDRPMRYEGETGHHFVSPEEFDKLEGKILETVFSNARYTMTNQLLLDSEIIVLDIPGIKEVKDAVIDKQVYVIALSCEDVKARMRERGDSEAEIAKRQVHDAEAFMELESLADVVIHNDGSPEQLVYMINHFIMTKEPGLPCELHINRKES